MDNWGRTAFSRVDATGGFCLRSAPSTTKNVGRQKNEDPKQTPENSVRPNFCKAWLNYAGSLPKRNIRGALIPLGLSEISLLRRKKPILDIQRKEIARD